MAEWAGSTSRPMTGTERRQARFLKEAAGPESSGDESGILEDDRCIDTGVFQKGCLLHELSIRLQPTPAAAATNQLHYPDSSRLVPKDSRGARCETGLLPVARTKGAGARVIW